MAGNRARSEGGIARRTGKENTAIGIAAVWWNEDQKVYQRTGSESRKEEERRSSRRKRNKRKEGIALV